MRIPNRPVPIKRTTTPDMTPKQQMEAIEGLVLANLRGYCGEVLDWMDGGGLGDGLVRRAASHVLFLEDEAERLEVMEAIIIRVALENGRDALTIFPGAHE